MSASSKKKLRNAQEAAKMTERQLAEQKEAKKVKLYTIAFVVVLVALLVTAITIGVNQTIRSSGTMEKKTVAVNINGHDISNAELNYFFIDTVNNFYSQNGSYASLFGLDLSQPLNQQVMDEATGETWADYFLTGAKDSAASVYTMYDAATAAGHTLSEDEAANVDTIIANMDLYASVYGYKDGNAYLKAMYGNGATMDSFRNYVEMSTLADSYYNAYQQDLEYTDADLRAAEAENYDKYSSFTYNYYYLSASRFLEGGTTAEDGTVTYSDEEKSASVAAAEAAAKTLTGEEITSAEALDAAIAALEINAGDPAAASTLYENNLYGSLNSTIAPWLTDAGREEGDIVCLENTSTDADGNKTVNGYYIVLFHGKNDNTFALKNVRHILTTFKGGTTDESGNTTYSEEEKAAAKTAADEILEQWKAGDATESSFAALATEKTDDTASAVDGGLYTDVYPGQMVAAFEDWCFADGRKVGDTGIVETEYGYHVMYFCGDSTQTYRDYQITNELTSADVAEWYAQITGSATITDGDCQYIRQDLVLSAN